MHTQPFSRLLEARLAAEDDKLNASMLSVQGEMAKRGVLQSSIALKAFYECAKNQLNNRAEVIVQTIFDEVDSGELDGDLDDALAIGKEALKVSFERVKEARRRFAGSIEAGLMNTEITSAFSDIDSFWEAKWAELQNSLLRGWRKLESQPAPTKAQQLRKHWENHPVLAPVIVIVPVIAIVVVVVTGIVGLFR